MNLELNQLGAILEVVDKATDKVLVNDEVKWLRKELAERIRKDSSIPEYILSKTSYDQLKKIWETDKEFSKVKFPLINGDSEVVLTPVNKREYDTAVIRLAYNYNLRIKGI